MILIVGLGNPGQKFQRTRHNLGFRIIDHFQKKRGSLFFSLFNYQKKFQVLITEGKFKEEKIILILPQTFMNNSGKAVKSFLKNYCNKKAMAMLLQRFKNFWVIHDDIDLPLGKIRISIGRGSAGHKGVESIIKELKTKNFVRFRIGICPKNGKPKNIEEFVLQKFNKEEEKIVKKVIKKTAKAIEISLKEGLEKAMNKFNR